MKPAYQRIAKKNQKSKSQKGHEGFISVQNCTLMGRVDEVVAKEVGVSTRNFQLGEKLLKLARQYLQRIHNERQQKSGKSFTISNGKTTNGYTNGVKQIGEKNKVFPFQVGTLTKV